jgi:ribonucleotide monophosphatase NagD (HAD superfamily)
MSTTERQRDESSRERLRRLRGVIVDVDGVVYVAGTVPDDARVGLGTLTRLGLSIQLLTNDCVSTRAERVAQLHKCGLAVVPPLETAVTLAGAWLRATELTSVMLLGSSRAVKDLGTLYLVRSNADVVLVGDYFGDYSRSLLQDAYRELETGAALVAMQRNRTWSDGSCLFLDNGFWVAGLEYATGVQATVIGKPAPGAYQKCLNNMALEAEVVAMVSDDLSSDLVGAQEVGLMTVHVTGGDRVRLGQPSHFAADMTVATLADFADRVRAAINDGHR